MKIKVNLLRDLIIALLVFLPSLVPVLLLLHLLILPFVFPAKTKLTITLQILILIIILSFANQIIHLNIFYKQDLNIKDLIPYSLFILVSYFFSINANSRVLKFIVYLVIFEILIGLLEYFSGVRSFIPSVRQEVSGTNPFGFKGMLYYSRVSGLSSNSSVLAIKTFVAVMLVYLLNFENKNKEKMLYFILGIGLLITFTRSVYVSLAFFILLVNLNLIKSIIIKFLQGKPKTFYLLIFTLAISFIIVILNNIELIFRQLNRGMKTVDLSSRDIVFQKFSNFFSENILFGNGSYKIWIEINGKLFHAHNVFMQTLSTNGLLIGSLYFILIAINLNKLNFKYIIPILILSIFQYAIFWGISFLDLIFFTFLLITSNKNLLKTCRL